MSERTYVISVPHAMVGVFTNQLRLLVKTPTVARAVIYVLILSQVSSGYSQDKLSNSGQDIAKYIPMRQRVQIMEGFWKWKMDNILPAVMKEQGVDLWIIREQRS